MEPLSALSIATSIVQFIDFSGKIVSGAHELYISSNGLSKDHTDLHEVSQTLCDLSRGIERPVTGGSSTQHGDQLRDLCRNVVLVANELIEVLEELRLKNRSRWESCYQALRSVWSKQRIEALQEKLNKFRQQLTLIVLVILREEVYSAQADVKQDISQMHGDFINYMNQNRQWRAEITKAIHEHYVSDTGYDSYAFQPWNIAKYGLNHSSADFTRHILNSLRFITIDDRHDRIAEAERRTFEWIFKETNPTDVSWTNFADWLKSPSSLYWITGKAGSGKSTLMKFLQGDLRTKQLLSSSMTVPIIEAGFFFWNSGSQMQMSQEGLMRTLLYQMLEQCKNLAPIAFPDRWEAFSLLGFFPPSQWTWHELCHAFRRLAKQIGSSKLLFLLIDGLDEYNGSHSDLVSFLKGLASNSTFNIKMCVSSRPWVVFEDAFNRDPSLKMQELTYPDIVLYASTKFEENLGFVELKNEEPEYATQLVQEIAEKADGVFLWVALVVKSLLIGLTNGDRISDLQERLAALPSDLEELFQKIIDNIEPNYRRQASELFQIFRAATEPPTILTFAFADHPELETALCFPVEPLSNEQMLSKIDRTRRRLNSRCRGLLEVTERNFTRDSGVSYLHRTVKDFMEDEIRWEKISNITPPSFDPHLQLSKSYLMQLKTRFKTIDQTEALRPLQLFMNECLNYASLARTSSMKNRIRLADELDSTLRTICSRELNNGKTLLKQTATPYKGAKPHWTHTKALVPAQMPQPASFLHYMVWSGREWYAKIKIGEGTAVRQKPPQAPLLFSALDTNLIIFRQIRGEKPFGFVKFLLDHGANPNEKFGGKTLYQLTSNLRDTTIREELQEILVCHGAVTNIALPPDSNNSNHGTSQQTGRSIEVTRSGSSNGQTADVRPRTARFSFRKILSRSDSNASS